MRANLALYNRGPDAIDTDTVIAVGARFVVKLISRTDKVMFAGNQYTALLHDVGKATRICSCQYRIQTRDYPVQAHPLCVRPALSPPDQPASAARGMPDDPEYQRNEIAGHGAVTPGADMLGAVTQ